MRKGDSILRKKEERQKMKTIKKIIYDNTKHSCIELVCAWYEQSKESICDFKYRHCLYVYLYKDHPLFEKIKTEDYCKYDTSFNWHGGATYGSFAYNKDGNILSKKIGCDYQHYGDKYISEECMHAVPLNDFNELFDYISSFEEEKK